MLADAPVSVDGPCSTFGLAPAATMPNHSRIDMKLRPCVLHALWFCALATAPGCSGSDAPVSAPGAAGPTLASASSVPVSGRNVRITWSKTDDMDVVIERKAPGAQDFVQVARRPASRGQFLDLALQPSTGYAYRITPCTSAGCGVPILPEPVTTFASRIPSVTLTVSEPGAGDQVLVMGLGSLVGDYTTNGLMMAVDRSGTILWEYENNKEGLITEVELLPSGRLAAEQLVSLVELDLDGAVKNKFTQRLAHHAMDLMADGRFAVLTFDRMQKTQGVVLGDGIAILSADWSKVEWEWWAREHIPLTDVCQQCINDDPYHLGYDWTHANGLTFDDAEHKLYFNARNLNRIYRIDYPTGAVDWVMGDGGDFGAGLWSHSHSPEFLPGNRVLMLDNGMHRDGGQEYSRVIEVAYDPVAKKADIAWEYRETPDFYAFALGSVHRLQSGNTFLADGVNGRMLEVTPEHKKVWELTLQAGYGTYKAITVPADLFGSW